MASSRETQSASETESAKPQATAETATAKAATAKKSEFKTLGNLRHDGKGYTKGKTIYLTAKEAKPLLDSKVVAPAEEKSK